MQEAVRGQRAAAAGRVVPGQVGEAPARLLHDQLRRREIPEVRRGLDRHVHAALGEQHVLPEVAEAARRPHAAGEREERLAEVAQARVGEDGVLEPRDLRDADRLAVRERAAAARRPPAPPERGRRDDRDLVLERDQRREERDPAHVVLRRVDRVHDPAASVALVVAVLLADDHVVGPLAREHGADRLLDGLVGLRDGRQVGLRLDAQVGRAEARERELVGRVRERESQVEVRRHAPSLSVPVTRTRVSVPNAGTARRAAAGERALLLPDESRRADHVGGRLVLRDRPVDVGEPLDGASLFSFVVSAVERAEEVVAGEIRLGSGGPGEGTPVVGRRSRPGWAGAAGGVRSAKRTAAARAAARRRCRARRWTGSHRRRGARRRGRSRSSARSVSRAASRRTSSRSSPVEASDARARAGAARRRSRRARSRRSRAAARAPARSGSLSPWKARVDRGLLGCEHPLLSHLHALEREARAKSAVARRAVLRCAASAAPPPPARDGRRRRCTRRPSAARSAPPRARC